ncbi:hypothetical protein D9615_006052 [Tricholomella constricta]|uniref:Rhodopsin domain-containing protein n=1 Tax=Tricholomella constricta TaxID=117010 RepID=A0A8H5M315_9AGAR|nr:hypothetical protein D9615_006052 [Tricholomella constricta]
MLNTSDPLVKIGITSVLCTVPAIAITIYRLWIRRGRYWADDAWALCSAVAQLVLFSGAFVRISNSSRKNVMIAAYYLMAAAFYSVIWFARLSILFSIIRIDPSASRRRRLLIVASCFLILYVVLICQLFWVCEPVPRWKEKATPQCPLPSQVIILQLVTDILADTILIVAPLKLIRNLSDQRLRRRLTIIFSTCLVTTIVSLVHAAFLFVRPDYKVVIAAIVEVCVSLIVCNIPVVVTSLLQFRREVRRNATGGPSNLHFASFRTNMGETVVPTIGPTTTTTTIGWANHFRWERRASESEDNLSHTTTTFLSNVDTTKKPIEVELLDVSGKSSDLHCVEESNLMSKNSRDRKRHDDSMQDGYSMT